MRSIFVLFAIYHCSTEAIISQGCYKWQSNGRISYQTVQYSDPSTMTIDSCENFCVTQQTSFAAIEAGQYCFCGQSAPNASAVPSSNCNITCTGNPADLTCGSYIDDFWLLNLGTPVSTSPIYSVSLSASYSTNNIGDQINFIVAVNTTTSYSISFDYGDGSPQTDFYPNLTAPSYRSYYAPGNYLVTVFVKDSSGQLQSTSVTVPIKLPLAEITPVVCPATANINEIINCTFTVGLGTNVAMSLDFGDGTIVSNAISDTVYFSTGLSPPNYNDTSMIANPIAGTAGKYAFMKMSDFQMDGIIYGFEMAFKSTSPNMKLKVVCPLPICNYCYGANRCDGCPSGVTSGNSQSTTCSSSNNLYFNAIDEVCYSSLNNSPVLLSERYSTSEPSNYTEYDFTSTDSFIPATPQNWMQLDVSQRFPVYSGCVLGYKPTLTSYIYYRDTKVNEISDAWVIPAPPYSSFQPRAIRHFLRAYAFQPQQVNIQHSYSQDGLYTVTGSVTDGQSTINLNATQVVVSIVLTIDCPPFAIINRQIECKVISPNASYGGTYYWTFENGTVASYASSVTTVNHTYSSLGSYVITVIRQSATTNMNVSFNATIDVIECACCPPIITPLQMSLDYSNPISFKKSQSVKQSVFVQLSCNDTLSNNKIWSLELSDGQNPPNALSTIPLPVQGQNFSSFTISPYALDFGLYRMTIKVQMNTNQLLYGYYPVESELSGYFRIVPGNIVPIIHQNQSRIALAYKSITTFNPGAESIDPNESPGSAPQYESFEWSCQLASGTGSTSFDADVSTWLQNCNSATGVRKLSDLTWGYLDFNTDALSVGSQYIISLTVTRYVTVYGAQITLSGTSSIVVDIVSGDMISMSIQCKCPETCFSSPSSLTVNPANPLMLTTICPLCPADAPSAIFVWNITDSAGTSVNFASFTEGDGTMLYLNPNFFASFPTSPLSVSLVYNYAGKQSYSYVTLVVNQPPSGGSCFINGTNGRAGLDQFYINCQNWYSSNEVASYTLYRVEPGQTEKQYIFTVPYMAHVVTLSCGLPSSYQYDLWVEIADSLGATTEYHLATVNISPYLPSREEIFDQLSLLSAEGNLATLLAFVDAVATSANLALATSASGTSFAIGQPECFTLPIDSACDSRTYASWIRASLLSAIQTQPPTGILDVIAIANTISHVIVPAETNVNAANSINSILAELNAVFEMTAPASSPELVQQAANAVFAMSTVYVNALHYNWVNSLPVGDQVGLQRYEYENYDTSLPEDPDDIVFFELMTKEQWQVDAAKRALRKAAETAAKAIQQSVDDITEALLKNSVVGQEPNIINAPYGQLFLQYSRVRNLTSPISLMNGVEVDFNDFCKFTEMSGCSLDYPIQTKIVYYADNLYNYADTSELVTTGSVEIEFVDPAYKQEISVKNSTIPVVIKFPQNVNVPTSTLMPMLSSYQILKMHKINMTKPNSTLEIDFSASNSSAQFALFVRFSDYVGPMSGDYDYMTYVSSNEFKWILPSNGDLHKTGIFYVGVGQLSPNDKSAVKMGDNYFLQNFTTDYTIGTSSPSCHFYKPHKKHWETEGCLVSNATTPLATVCECYHLTVFGAGVFVPPNAIDFDFVFSHADFAENISIYMTIIAVFIIYIVLILWAKFKDQEDLEKLGCIPMPDNDANDHYIYEVIVMTGLRKAAATDSKVHMVISGDLCDTDAREFGHPLGPTKIFRRGMTNHFVLTTKRPLGDLRLIRVWHDNTGQGEFASWYLKEIVILDIHTGRKYPFVCNQWLGVEHHDGAIDRVIPVSTKDELTEFNHLFTEISSKELFDGHIWFSVFGRPPGSRFTRVQRVSCCLCVLMTSMLASAMWYGTIPNKPSSGLKFGPFSISFAEIGVGVMSSFIVFPVNFALVYIFRKSAKRTKRPSRFYEAFKNFMPHFISSGHAVHMDQKVQSTEHTAAMTKVSGKKKPFLLPWWCRYVAWGLFAVAVSLSTIFVIFYGIQFGDTKSRQWLTSMVMSFVSSVLLTEPLQIILTALLFSLICRKAKEEVDDDWIQDEHDFGLKSDQQWLHESGHGSFRFFDSVDKDKLEHAKYSRKIELGMYNTVREVLVYLFYVWIVFVLAYGGRDPMSWHHQNNLRNLFLAPKTINGLNYTRDVQSTDLYWEWAVKVLAPALRAPHWYNGQPNIGERGFIADHINRLLGFATLRQVRIQPNTCSIPDVVRSVVRDCIGSSHITLEQEGNFGPSWKPLQNGETASVEYVHRSASDLNNIITTGISDIYSGGGYLVTLVGNVSNMQTTLNRLRDESWIDHHTRAVFVEFSTFDPYANMFSVNQIVAEFLPQGSIMRSAYFQPIKLLPYNESFSVVELICQAIYVLYIVVFIVKEIRNLKEEGKKYFTHFWSLIEMSIIFCAVSSIVTFILRLIETNRVLDIYNETNGNSVLSLQRALFLDSIYTTSVAFGCFTGTLKLARLLRFNRRVSLVETTFHNCKQDLSHFFFVFLLLFFTFCQVFYLLLQAKMEMFTNFLSTMCGTFAYMMGQQDYKTLFAASPILAPLLFVIFIFIMSILMVNVFLTIIITMFIAIKHDSTKHSNEYEILEYMELKMRLFFGLPPSTNQKACFNNHHTDLSSYHLAEKRMDKLVKRIDNLYLKGSLETERFGKAGQKEGIKQSH